MAILISTLSRICCKLFPSQGQFPSNQSFSQPGVRQDNSGLLQQSISQNPNVQDLEQEGQQQFSLDV